MPEWLNAFLTFKTIVPVLTLGGVLFLDFVFKRVAYDRSDPLSFSLLGFSFLLVVTDVALKVIRILEKRKDPEYKGMDDLIFVLVAFACVLAMIGIFYLAKIAHVSFQKAQHKVIHKYLAELKAGSSTGNGVWGALEALGKNMIEPDLFAKNPAKEGKRIDFLEKVRDLTNVDIKPEDEQGKLLVAKGRERFWALVMYVFTFTLALVVTLYFFAERNNLN